MRRGYENNIGRGVNTLRGATEACLTVDARHYEIEEDVCEVFSSNRSHRLQTVVHGENLGDTQPPQNLEKILFAQLVVLRNQHLELTYVATAAVVTGCRRMISSRLAPQTHFPVHRRIARSVMMSLGKSKRV